MSMANKIPLVALMLLISILSVISANEPAPKPSKIEKNIGELEKQAQDAIITTVAELRYAKEFMKFIPRLKTLANLNGKHGTQVVQCVGGLTSAMNNVLMEVEKMENSWPYMSWRTETKTLQNEVDVVLTYKVICDHALEGVDGTIKLMVRRKIQDVAMLTNDVIRRVAKVVWH